MQLYFGGFFLIRFNAHQDVVGAAVSVLLALIARIDFLSIYVLSLVIYNCFITRPNEFGSMNARKGNTKPWKTIKRPYKTIERPHMTLIGHERP